MHFHLCTNNKSWTIGNPKSSRLSLTLVWMLLPITFTLKSKKEVSLSEVFAYITEVLLDIYQKYFLKFRDIDGEYIVKISKGIIKHVYMNMTFRLLTI